MLISRPARGARRLPSQMQVVDDRAMNRIVAVDHGPLRPLLRLLAKNVNLFVPYVAVSLWLLSKGNESERTAVAHGWVAAAVTSVLQGTLLKPAFHRSRPDARRLPRGERRETSPSTSAFPSGHGAAATAFSVATARGAPRSRGVLATATGVGGYAEVYTGRHHLSDVLAGTLLGAVVGILMSRLPLGAGARAGTTERHDR